jgi:hypothetical protein
MRNQPHKAKHFILALTVTAMSVLTAAAQQGTTLYSKGIIFSSKGSTLFVKGSVVNGSANGINLHNAGQLHLTGDLINEAGVLFQSS